MKNIKIIKKNTKTFTIESDWKIQVEGFDGEIEESFWETCTCKLPIKDYQEFIKVFHPTISIAS